MLSNNDHNPQPGGILKRRRSILLAGTFALAIAGFAAGQALLPQSSTSAIAQITTDRPAHQYSFADVVERVRPAVVSVKVKVDQQQTMNFGGGDNFNRGEGFNRGDVPPQMEEFFRRFFGDRNTPNRPGQNPRNRRTSGQGSGFFISADGYVVTNNHVIDKSTEVEITTDDGKSYPAKVVGSDPRTDVALLKVDGRSDFPWVKFGTNAPRVGDWVLAVGNPFGLGGTVTAGIVSARGRDIGANVYDDFIQIDAAVNRGNSGGPTFNLAGEVIGVNTAIVSPSGGNVGIAFAIPAENVNRIVTSLKATGTVTRGFIGVNIQPVTKEIADTLGLKDEGGALVSDVSADAPAAKAGIQSGDTILAVDGERLKDGRDLSRRIAAKQPGSTVKLLVVRDKKERTIDVTLARLPDQQRASTTPQRNERQPSSTTDTRLGLSLAPAKSVAGAGNNGVVVTNVEPNGPGAERGLRSGDVILEVAGKPVSSPDEVRGVLDDARKDDKKVVLMRVKRENSTRFVALPVERG